MYLCCVRFLPIINEVCQEREFLFVILCVIVMKLQTRIVQQGLFFQLLSERLCLNKLGLLITAANFKENYSLHALTKINPLTNRPFL